MKTKTFYTIILLSIFAFNSVAQDSKGQNLRKIKFKITGMTNTEGSLMISLFNSEATFIKETFKFKTQEFQDWKEVIVEFDGITPGIYAASVSHDYNNNGELDTGTFGKPTEKYGFSNNARGMFGPATFEDAKFEVNDQDVVQEIKIK